MGRGRVGVTACADRLEGSGRVAAQPHLSSCETWPRGPSALPAEGASDRLSAGAFGVLSSRQVLCLEEDCQALRRGLPSSSPNLYPLR